MQSAVRGFLARRTLLRTKQLRLQGLSSNWYYVKFAILESATTDPARLFAPNEKPKDLSMDDKSKRIYIDVFEDRDNSGIKYKGQW